MILAKDTAIINQVDFTTPVGPMCACATSAGICLLEFTDKKILEHEFADLCNNFNAEIAPGNNPHLDQLQTELKEYFAATRKTFNVKLNISGTQFQQLVWGGLLKISYGQTWSYKEQALAIDKVKAVRAVGAANGRNKISIIIPCHRVIGNNGNLVGYAGGLERKKWLLDFEKAHSIL